MKKILFTILFLALLGFSHQAMAAIAVDATSTATTGSGTAASLTFAHTCTGSNLVLTVGTEARDQFPTGVTYNGVAMTSLGTLSNSVVYTSLWQLVNPATGANNIVVTYSSATYNAAGGISFSGAAGTFGTVATNSGSSAATTLTVVSETGSLVVDVVGHGCNTTLTSSQTTQYVNYSADSVGGSTKAGEASTIMAWTETGSSVWATVGVSVKAAVAAAPSQESDFIWFSE